MRKLLFHLRKCTPDFLAKWGMQNNTVRRLLKGLLVSPDSLLEIEIPDGCVLRLHPAVHLNYWFYGGYENHIVTALRNIIKPGDVVWDVGANIGYFSVLFAKWVGAHGQVVAFEPHPKNCMYLEENSRLNHFEERILVLRAAASSISGWVRLAGPKSDMYRVSQEGPPAGGNPGLRVKAVALDDFVRERGTRAPSVVKMDVEGHEGKVLEGMAQTLAQNDIRILLELHGRKAVEECRRVLREVKYAAYDVFGNGRIEVSDERLWAMCRREAGP